MVLLVQGDRGEGQPGPRGSPGLPGPPGSGVRSVSLNHILTARHCFYQQRTVGLCESFFE